MKIKTDENIGRAGIQLLIGAGHDVATVHQQGLSGASDQTIFEACGTEARTLIRLTAISDKFSASRLNRPPASSFWNSEAQPHPIGY